MDLLLLLPQQRFLSIKVFEKRTRSESLASPEPSIFPTVQKRNFQINSERSRSSSLKNILVLMEKFGATFRFFVRFHFIELLSVRAAIKKIGLCMLGRTGCGSREVWDAVDRLSQSSCAIFVINCFMARASRKCIGFDVPGSSQYYSGGPAEGSCASCPRQKIGPP